jgi:serine/threonine protein kinase
MGVAHMRTDAQRPESMIGRVIAGYELTEYLGSGATGRVFRGRRAPGSTERLEPIGAVPTQFPRDAAIKLLVPPFASTQDELDEFQRRFLREARTLRQLNHPHIVPVIDSGSDDHAGFFYMTLPFMAGGSLAERITSQGPLPLRDVSAVLTDIASALDYAHQQGIVHRDIKPGNILLDLQGASFLCDFSIVRVLSDAATHRTATGRVMGTPAYMAPEQFDDSSKIGPAADIYGLGMVTYAMVMGQPAFRSTSWFQAMKQHMQDAPAPPGLQRPDLPAPAGAAILRALEKKPLDRFRSASEFASAFVLGLSGRSAAGSWPLVVSEERDGSAAFRL